MARIVKTGKPVSNAPVSWREAGEEVVIIALDRNEVVALVNATRAYHARSQADPRTDPTSLNAGGARVHEALVPIKRANGWA